MTRRMDKLAKNGLKLDKNGQTRRKGHTLPGTIGTLDQDKGAHLTGRRVILDLEKGALFIRKKVHK